MTALNQAEYERHLHLARRILFAWDPMRHPRDLTGRFRSVEIKAGRLGSIFSRRTPGLPDNTQDLHTVRDAKGRWVYTPDRQAFHQALIAAYLKGHRPDQDKPRAVFTAGGSGSGKTTALGKISDLESPDSVRIDPDEIMLQLPEYRRLIREGDPRAATLTHDEAIDIAQQLLARALKDNYHVTMDGTGASPMFVARVERALDAKYEVEIAYFNTDADTAWARVQKRALETKRKVNEQLHYDMHRNASRIFPQIFDLGTAVRIYDVTGEQPGLIAEAQAGADLDVYDQKAYDAFIAKGNATRWVHPQAAVTQIPLKKNGKPKTAAATVALLKSQASQTKLPV